MKLPFHTLQKLGFELIVVFAGMTGAIALDNYRESSRLNHDERELLQFMVNDLDSDIQNLTELIRNDSVRYNTVSKEFDVSFNKFVIDVQTADFSPERFAYSIISSSQKVGTIRSKELMQEVFLYYQLCEKSEKIENDFFDVEREFRKYLIEDKTDRLEIINSDPLNPASLRKYLFLLSKKQYDNQAIGQYLNLYKVLIGLKYSNELLLLKKAQELKVTLLEYLN